MNTPSDSEQSRDEPANASDTDSAKHHEPAAGREESADSPQMPQAGNAGASEASAAYDSDATRKSDSKAESANAGEDAAEDDLPEEEPLTPELVEDEALRGDFVLRWAVVLLALLIGCTAIFETDTLVHVKSGQNILQHGFPPRNDVFSSTATDRPWINLSWLFDVVLACLYGIGEFLGSGGVALSVVKALMAAAVFALLVHINRRDVSTWWGTICAVLALLACHRQFTARPELVTLFGLVLTMRFLHQWKEQGQPRSLKGLVVLFLLWANLDPHMYLGLAVLVFYALGEALGDWLGFPGLPDAKRRKYLWAALGGGVLVTFINPFGWHALLSPVSLYGGEYPAFRTYNTSIIGYEQLRFLKLIDSELWSWDHVNLSVGAGLLLLLTSAVALVLNFRRLDLGDVFLWLAFVGFAVLAVHELAAAAVVTSVLATLNAQQWYQHTFRQTYSVQTSELIFSRGGRAVTVLSLFAVAYLAISGLSVGGLQFSRRTSVGLHPDLQGAIAGLQEELDDAFDNRPFNFVLSQGDLLIWIDRRPFIDSRLKLYAGGNGDDVDLVQLHHDTRKALREADRSGAASRRWKSTLNRFGITHALPRLDSRLTRSSADYDSFLGLLASPDWQLTRMGATTAVFYRTDVENLAAHGNRSPRWRRKYSDYLETHEWDFVTQAFGRTIEGAEPRADFPAGPTWMQKYLRRPQPNTPNAVEEAGHYVALVQPILQGRFPAKVRRAGRDQRSVAAALLHLAIHKANEGLDNDESPHHVQAYRVLGFSYYYLEHLETQQIGNVARQRGEQLSPRLNQLRSNSISTIRSRRFRQAVHALRQALILEPEHLNTTRLLARLYHQHQKWDLALNMLEKAIDIATRNGPPEPDTPESQAYCNDVELKKQIEANTEELRQRLQQGRSQLTATADDRQNRWNLLRFAVYGLRPGRDGGTQYEPGAGGFIQMALDLLEEDPEMRTQNLNVALLWIDCLQQAGRTEEAVEALQTMSELVDEQQIGSMLGTTSQTRWQQVNAYAALAQGDYLKARGIWYQSARQRNSRRIVQMLETVPLAMRLPQPAFREILSHSRQNRGTGFWVLDHAAGVRQGLQNSPPGIARLLLLAAMTDLEAGRPERAAPLLQEILDIAPDSPLRPLVVFYLSQTTGQRPRSSAKADSSASLKRHPVGALKP